GSGPLAARVHALVLQRGFQATRLTEDRLVSEDGRASRFEIIRQALASVDVETLGSAILVDDRDDRNLELAIALLSINARLPVAVSMFNESIAPHLQAANPALRILNPARIAAPVFVDALEAPLHHELRYKPLPPVTHRPLRRADLLIRGLVAGFALLLLAAITYFHAAEH